MPQTKQARWSEGRKADDYAHVEVYCMRALDRCQSAWTEEPDDPRSRPIFDPRKVL